MHQVSDDPTKFWKEMGQAYRLDPAPLRNAIHYEGRHFDTSLIYLDEETLNPQKTTSFNGPPRPNLDEAWHDLLKCECPGDTCIPDAAFNALSIENTL